MSGPPSGGIGAMGPQHDEQPREVADAPAGERAPTEAGTGLERPEAIRAAEETAGEGGRPLTIAADDAPDAGNAATASTADAVPGDTYVPNDAPPDASASAFDAGITPAGSAASDAPSAAAETVAPDLSAASDAPSAAAETVAPDLSAASDAPSTAAE